jgi:hypothetical protein
MSKVWEYKYTGDPRAQDIIDMMARYALKNKNYINLNENFHCRVLIDGF